MNKIHYIFFPIVLIVLGVILVYSTSENDSSNLSENKLSKEPKTQHKVVKADLDKEVLENERRSIRLNYQEYQLRNVPRIFKPYFKSEHHRTRVFLIDTITDTELTLPEVQFLKNELINPANSPWINNSIGGLLLKQKNKDPNLYRNFISVLNAEKGEFHQEWVDFSIQFLGLTLPFAKDKELVIYVLNEASKEKDSLNSGTAILQLAYREKDGYLKFEDNFNEKQTLFIDDSSTHTYSAMTAIAAIGIRKDKENLDLIREYAMNTATPKKQRVAIAALGNYHKSDLKPTDIEFLQEMAESENRLIQIAAESALTKLENN